MYELCQQCRHCTADKLIHLLGGGESRKAQTSLEIRVVFLHGVCGVVHDQADQRVKLVWRGKPNPSSRPPEHRNALEFAAISKRRKGNVTTQTYKEHFYINSCPSLSLKSSSTFIFNIIVFKKLTTFNFHTHIQCSTGKTLRYTHVHNHFG